MSLGVKSLWRAQTWSVCIKELSLVPVVPREQHHHTFSFRRWISLSPSRSAPWGSSSSSSSSSSGEGQYGYAIDVDDDLGGEDFQITATSSSSPATKRSILQQQRQQQQQRATKRKPRPELQIRPSALPLIRPPTRYPSPHETARSLRKHVASADRQRLHDALGRAHDKPDDDWRSILSFMLRHTPSADATYNIRVVIGRGAAIEARRVLSGLDTNIAQIERRHQSVVRFEEGPPPLLSGEGEGEGEGEGSLVLVVSGAETAVRGSLRDIVKASGQVTAVRVLDEYWKEKLGDIWRGAADASQSPVSQYGGSEVVAGDRTITVHGDPAASRLDGLVQPERHRYYWLMKRADEISPPDEWTKLSFEKYISDLVHGVLSSNLARRLYKHRPPHQKTVVSLLVDAFTSDLTRPAVSVSALKMALIYIHSKGPVFRPAARQIFSQAESLHLPIDAETFGIFLANASKAGDLNNFNSILKLMVRKRFHVQSHTWYTFLEMVQDAKTKRYIVSKMEAKGLLRIPVFSAVIGRQLAPIDLQSSLRASAGACDIGAFVASRDAKYGKEWLNTMTLNKLLDLLGRHNLLGACHELLDLVFATGRAGCPPDAYTLNTLITHTRRVADHIALLESTRARWPWLRPDDVTYHQLFQIAWRTRLPNAVRVVWLYATHSGHLNSKMRHRLTTLLRDNEKNFSNRRFLLKAWQDTIFGWEELRWVEAAVRGPGFREGVERDDDDSDSVEDGGGGDGDGGGGGGVLGGERRSPLAHHLEQRHLANAKGMKPSVEFATKLREAYELDLEIHRLVREGHVLTPAMRQELTVDIPLQRQQQQQQQQTGEDGETLEEGEKEDQPPCEDEAS